MYQSLEMRDRVLETLGTLKGQVGIVEMVEKQVQADTNEVINGQ